MTSPRNSSYSSLLFVMFCVQMDLDYIQASVKCCIQSTCTKKASSTSGCSAFLSVCLLPGPQSVVDTNFLIFSCFTVTMSVDIIVLYLRPNFVLNGRGADIRSAIVLLKQTCGVVVAI
ncbi:unnamed protein product [Acanthoscelides obtectus]|uniref:Uncharacterized protein n=1 Tax=Acanthoscelides obtectus TaxID=200917 RepID=A0A9P0JWM3_ACAOB|nr:unnamed protein product [Acanthoscelides obtectus]CAK1627872.1 hypothetical protein AOBTE_LOCUS4879 [Acanthoscelides obtectus]